MRSSRARSALPLLLAVAVTLLAETPARAEDATRTTAPATSQLTSRGRFLVSGTIGGSWSAQSVLPATGQSYRVYASPALIYLLRERLGIGLTLGGSISRTQPGADSVTFRQSDLFVGLLAAFDLAISEQLSLLFQPAFHYVNQWNDSSEPDIETSPSLITFPNSLHLQIVRPALSLQLVVRVSPHVGFVFGPDFWADFIVDDGGLRRIQAMITDKKQSYMRTQLGLSAGLLLSF